MPLRKTSASLFVVKDMTNPYYWRMGEGAKKAAEELGIELSWVSAQFNGDIEGQIAVVESELAKSPDAMVLVPMNAQALIPKIREANQMGIPVVTADTRAEGRPCRSGYIRRAGRKTVVHGNGGIRRRPAWRQGQGGQSWKGFRGSSTAEERLVGMNEVLDAQDGIEIVASDFWRTGNARRG